MTVPLWAWAAFAAVILVMLAIDLFAHRDDHVISFRQAAWWSALWVGVSLVFATVVALTLGADAGVDFTTAWLLEKSLSVDNLFVFALIFAYFQVPRRVPAPSAVLRRHRRAGVPRHLPRRGCRGRQQVHRRAVRLRGDPAVERLQADEGRRRDRRPGQEPRGPAAPQGHAGAGRVRGASSSSRRPASGSRPRCSPSSSRSRPPTWSSPSTACRPSSRSATTRSSSTPATRSRSSACAPCTSCSPGCWRSSTTSPRASRSSSPSSA